MKKEYMKPSMEVVEMKNGQQLLAGSQTMDFKQTLDPLDPGVTTDDEVDIFDLLL